MTNNVHGIVIPVLIFSAKSGSKQVILHRPRETFARKCESNLDDGSCKSTLCTADGSEQVSFVATCQGDNTDRFASGLGNLYAKLKWR